MSESLSVTIAEAVRVEIDSVSFSLPIVVRRTWLPRYEPGQLAETQVAIVPSGEQIVQATRSKNAHEVTLDISVMRRVTDDAGADGLSRLAEELADHLRLKRLPEFESAVWSGTELYVTHSRQHLQEQNVFLSVFRVKYRVVR